MRIYLAGKIAKHGWRDEICQGSGGMMNGSPFGAERWEEEPFEIEGIRHLITGPFFVGDDHGCYHGEGYHGVLDGGRGCCTADAPLRPVTSRNGIIRVERQRVVSLCLAAIRNSDLVFAWIDAPSAYGTMFELGYALGIGTRVFIATAPSIKKTPPSGYALDCRPPDGAYDHWFSEIACQIVQGDTPKKALANAIVIARRKSR